MKTSGCVVWAHAVSEMDGEEEVGKPGVPSELGVFVEG
jgi:hypothetical protein